MNPELRQFLDVIPRVIAPHIPTGSALLDDAARAALHAALSDSDLLDLGIATEDLPDALTWLAETVRAVAASWPSLAYALAARYAAQVHSLSASEPVHDDSAFVLLGLDGDIVYPTLLPVAQIVVAGCVGVSTVRVVDPHAADTAPRPATGLRHAALRQISGPSDAGIDDAVDGTPRPLTILISAATVGAASAALAAAESYAAERHQFGAPISSFAGLREILTRMRLHVATMDALLRTAVETSDLVAALELSRATGAAVEVTLDAVQVHGGYGYIEEFPAAGLVRDVVSLGARNVSHHAAGATIATARLGTVTA